MQTPEFSLFLLENGLIDKSDDRFRAIMRWSDVDVFRQPVSFLFPADAHGRMDRLLEKDSHLFANVLFPRVPLRLKSGGYINFDMKIDEQSDGSRRLDFFKPEIEAGSVNGQEEPKKPTDMYSFFNFVEQLLDSPFEGDLDLTMVGVDALKDGHENSLNDDDKKALRQEIETNLSAKAIGGNVGQLDEASYGLLTSGDFDEAAFESELKTVAERLNLDPTSFSVRSANVEIDDRDIEPQKLRQALGQSRSIFVGDIDDPLGLNNLSGVLDGIEHNRKLIENAIDNYQYRTSARLIMDNRASVSVATLQEGKVNLEGRIRLPDEILVLPDHPDLALRHDLAQIEDLLKERGKRPEDERTKIDYYGLCRSTLLQDGFFEALEILLSRYGELASGIGFRIKGLPPVRRGGPHWDGVKRLADKGHSIWLDRFGDAVVEPDALSCLKDGLIEMPAKLMRKLAGHFDGKDLMSQLITSWQGLGVGVVSADLPDYDLKTLAQELGITLALADSP